MTSPAYCLAVCPNARPNTPETRLSTTSPGAMSEAAAASSPTTASPGKITGILAVPNARPSSSTVSAYSARNAGS